MGSFTIKADALLTEKYTPLNNNLIFFIIPYIIFIREEIFFNFFLFRTHIPAEYAYFFPFDLGYPAAVYNI